MKRRYFLLKTTLKPEELIIRWQGVMDACEALDIHTYFLYNSSDRVYTGANMMIQDGRLTQLNGNG